MIEKTPTNSTTGTKKSFKKKLRFKVVLYIVLSLILLILGASIYFKVKFYLNNNENSVTENFSKENLDPVNSVNSNMLSEYLQKQQEFQQDVYNKINDLSREIKQNKLVSQGTQVPNNDSSKVFLLEKAPVVTTITKKDNKDNFGVIYNLIQALNSKRSFIAELDAFKITPEAQHFNNEISNLYNIASKGIPCSYDLALSFIDLQPSIKIETYQQDKGVLGKIKYYLSFLIVVQKVNNFKDTEFTLDSYLYNIEKLLLENKPEHALYVFNNNLKNIKTLSTWAVDLNYRVMANTFILKLQQLLLNGLYVDN